MVIGMMVISGMGIVAIVLVLGFAAMLLRWLLGGDRSSGRFPLGLAVVLIVLWLSASRRESRQTHTQQAWVAQQQAVAQQHVDVANQMAAQSAAATQRIAEQQVAASQRLVESQLKASRRQVASTIDALAATKALATPTAPPVTARRVPPLKATVIDGTPATWVLLTPLALILAAVAGLVVARRAQRVEGGSGLSWLVVGVAVLVLVGYLFVGSIQTGEVIPGRVVAEVDLDRIERDGGDLAFDGPDNASMDAIWERLSAPQIKLEAPPGIKLEVAPQVAALKEPVVLLSPKQVTVAQGKLNDAARVLELAAEGMTESNSQGWLVVMAEALLKATSKTSPEKPASPVEAPQPKPDAKALAAAVAAPARTPQPPSTPIEKERWQLNLRMPDWVIHHPGIVGEVRKIVVSGGPYKTLGECHRELEDKMRTVVQARVIELVKSAHGDRASVPSLQAMGIGTEYILRELCTEEYVETNEYDFGDMLTAHALMEFNAAQDAALVDHWQTYARRAGVERTVLGAGLAIGGLALAFGLLKVDTWTRGYYTKRLFLGVPAAIIAAVALLTLA